MIINSILFFNYIYITYDIDRSLSEPSVDKIRKYRPDSNNNPPNRDCIIYECYY
jgi:hypothetical protein